MVFRTLNKSIGKRAKSILLTDKNATIVRLEYAKNINAEEAEKFLQNKLPDIFTANATIAKKENDNLKG